MHMGDPSAQTSPVSRRALLTSAAAGTGIAATAGYLAGRQPMSETGLESVPAAATSDTAEDTSLPFYGSRQTGVTARQQPYTLLVGFGLRDQSAPVSEARTALAEVLRRWTDQLGQAAAGACPALTAMDVRAARLTATVGIGPFLASRLDLAAPPELRGLPALPGDRLDPARSDADVLVQLCADDRWALTNTVELLRAQAETALRIRWRQAGFLPPERPGVTPRNLLGFKDGTANPGPADQDQWVWYPQGRHADGTLMVYRRIRIDTAAFAALPVTGQEAVIGRYRTDGAPLGETDEFDQFSLWSKHPDGSYVIPATAHVRLADPRFDAGARMLRRGYSYDDDVNDQGLLFCAFMRDPALFTRVQSRLAQADALGRYIQHVASAVAYVLPGATSANPLGATLF